MFEVGEKVKIKNWDDLVEEFGSSEFGYIDSVDVVPSMKPYCGKIVTVSEVCNGSVLINEDGGKWFWIFETLEKLDLTKPKLDKYDMFVDITQDMWDLYYRKNQDYGDSFGRIYNKRGALSALIRLEDKINRLDSIISNDGEVLVEDETLEDTLIDLANYSIMWLMELRGEIDG